MGNKQTANMTNYLINTLNKTVHYSVWTDGILYLFLLCFQLFCILKILTLENLHIYICSKLISRTEISLLSQININYILIITIFYLRYKTNQQSWDIHRINLYIIQTPEYIGLGYKVTCFPAWVIPLESIKVSKLADTVKVLSRKWEKLVLGFSFFFYGSWPVASKYLLMSSSCVAEWTWLISAVLHCIFSFPWGFKTKSKRFLKNGPPKTIK